MKKQICVVLTALLTLCLWSCKPEQKEEPASLEVKETSFTFGAISESRILKFETNRDWQITDIPDWIVAEPSKGQAGKIQVKLIAKDNPASTERQARIAINAEKIVYIGIKQAVKGYLNVKEREFFFFAPAKKVIINCEGNLNPEVVIPQEAKSWLKFVSNNVIKDSRIILDMAQNDDIPRQAEIKIVDKTNNISEAVFIKQYPDPKVNIAKDAYYLLYNQTEAVIEFDSNIPFEPTLEATEKDWISVKSSNFAEKKFSLTLALSTNSADKMRSATLVLKNTDCDKTYTFKITQAYRAESGLAVQLHKATHKPKIDWSHLEMKVKKPVFIFTGDGFTKADIESGKYQSLMMEAYNAIFTTEPFKALKDWFDAWILYAESKEGGITTVEEHEANKHRDTHYGVYFYDRSRGMTLNDFGGVIDRCREAIEKAGGEYHPETGVIVMIANTPIYGGTCILDRSTGRAVAICPTSEEDPGVFPRIVSHEAGGHGFGKLADEYSTGGGISESEKRTLRDYHTKKHYMNVTLESDKSKAPWAFMYDREGYEDVNHFEGGYTFASGVWRSTHTSLMRENRTVSQFNAYSRYLIFERLYNIYENIDGIADAFPIDFRPKPVKDWFFELDKPNVKKK